MTDATAARAVYLSREGQGDAGPGDEGSPHGEPSSAAAPARSILRHRQQRRGGATVDAGTGRGGRGRVEAVSRWTAPCRRWRCCPRPAWSRARNASCAGPFTLQAIFTLGDGDMLSLGGKLTAAAGDYRDAAGASTMMRANIRTPAAADGGVRLSHGAPGHLPEALDEDGLDAGLPGLREEVRGRDGDGQAARDSAAPRSRRLAARLPSTPGEVRPVRDQPPVHLLVQASTGRTIPYRGAGRPDTSMTDKKNWGHTVMGWFIESDDTQPPQAAPSADAPPPSTETPRRQSNRSLSPIRRLL